MARSMDIFVKSEAPIKIFVKEIETLLRIKLQGVFDAEEVYHEFQNAHIIFTVGTHDLVNDREMNFEDYHYHLSVWAPNIGAEANPRKWRNEFAQFVFQKLKKSQRSRLMLVEDVQVKLETSCPT